MPTWLRPSRSHSGAGGTAIANKIPVAHIDPMSAGVLRSMLTGFIAIAVARILCLPLPLGAGAIILAGTWLTQRHAARGSRRPGR